MDDDNSVHDRQQRQCVRMVVECRKMVCGVQGIPGDSLEKGREE